MSEDHKKRGGGAGGAGIIMLVVAILVLMPILYVLSVGPIIWLANHDYISKDGNLYVPLQWARDHWEPFNRAVSWYMGLFS